MVLLDRPSESARRGIPLERRSLRAVGGYEYRVPLPPGCPVGTTQTYGSSRGWQAYLSTHLLAVMAGEAWDGAADRFVNEIASMRDLIALAGKEVVVPKAPSVKLSDLKTERDELAR